MPKTIQIELKVADDKFDAKGQLLEGEERKVTEKVEAALKDGFSHLMQKGGTFIQMKQNH